METKLLILSAIFTTCLVSCEKNMQWLNPDDPEADLSKINAVCEEKHAECGYIEQEFDGKMRKIFCGECTQEGYECKTYNRCGDIDECADTTLNNCHGNFECHNLDIKFDGKPFECVCKKNYSGDDCTPDTKTIECVDLPENAEWNSVSEITQTWNGKDWQPSNQGTFNEESSETECRFKCKEDYFWNDSECLSDTRTFKCSDIPENAVYNTVDEITQTWNGEDWIPSDESYFSETPSTTECRFKCKSAVYNWNGSRCISTLPECSTADVTPCYDSSTNYIWSEKASMLWPPLKDLCTGLNSSNYGGYSSGWHLPTIDELKTLLIWSKASSCKVSETNNCLARDGCWTCSSCTETCSDTGDGCGNCSYYYDGRFSKFGDIGIFWSSSAVQSDDSVGSWYVDFSYGYVGSSCIVNGNDGVRCVRSDSGDTDTDPTDTDNDPIDTDNDPTTPCDPNPCSSIENSTGACTLSGSDYICGCNDGYFWNGSSCTSAGSSLPECSSSNTGPCYDSTSHLTWSKKADTTYTWSNAGTYCDNLTEGGYSDWRLPNISELRTLIKNCSGTQMPGGSCGVIDTGNSSTSCLSSSCWTDSACYSCSSDSTGGHSKFGETGYFWSSSTTSDFTDYA